VHLRFIHHWHVPRHDARGQSLVEFSFILPLFLVMVMSMIEFAFVFNAQLSINFASRDAAAIAATAGNLAGADCLVLQKVEQGVTAPADRSQIKQVVIFWADQNGVIKNGAANTYTRGGTMSCTYTSGHTVTIPYTLSGTAGYPASARCSVIAGCDANHTGVDTVAVSITYLYTWHTPFPSLLPFLNHGSGGSGGGGYTFVQTNAMRMEPTL
jgi:Flp pilus assembly protein TadG